MKQHDKMYLFLDPVLILWQKYQHCSYANVRDRSMTKSYCRKIENDSMVIPWNISGQQIMDEIFVVTQYKYICKYCMKLMCCFTKIWWFGGYTSLRRLFRFTFRCPIKLFGNPKMHSFLLLVCVKMLIVAIGTTFSFKPLLTGKMFWHCLHTLN